MKYNKGMPLYAVFPLLYREDVLSEAWKRVKANKGSSGVDGIEIEDIETMGIEKYLTEIKEELMDGKYKPSPVRRVMIPKPDGSKRPLGIPTVKDRIVQMATKIAIEPVFEADFRECSYGFRPKRSAKQALEKVRKAMKKMKAEIKRNVNNRSLLVAKEEDLIKNLNPKITGWKNYYSTKTNEKWMQALDWYIICSFARWYNKKHRRRHHMSKVGFVRNSIYEKGLKKMAKA